MSEDIKSTATSNDVTEEEQSNQATKRRKRSKWDIQTPIADSTIPIKTNISLDNSINSLNSFSTNNFGNNFINTTIKQPTVIDINVLQQQAQLAQYTQQIALKQAQQMGLQKVQQKLAYLQQPILPPLSLFQQQQSALLNHMPIIQPSMAVSSRIYVGSINYDIRQNDMIALFSSFGTITKCEMSIDSITGKSKGFCFVEYSDPASAEAAQVMDGFELAGRKMKVGRPLNGDGAVPASLQNGKYGCAPPPSTLLINSTMPQQQQLPVTLSSLGIPVINSSNNNPLQIPMTMQPYEVDKKNCLLVSNVKAEMLITDLDKLFNAFGSISNCQYVALEASTNTKLLLVEYIETAHAFTSWLSMNNSNLGGLTLKCEVIANSIARQLLQSSSFSGSNINPNNYKVLLLNNMITIEDAKDPELKDEISEEATIYGELVNIDIIANESEQKAIVKLYFNDSISAGKAFKAMNNRVFAGNTINAILLPE